MESLNSEPGPERTIHLNTDDSPCRFGVVSPNSFGSCGLPRTEGFIPILTHHVRLLFDSGATHSFIAENCVDRLGLVCDLECEPFVVGLPNGDKLVGTRGLKDFPILIVG